jgi:hypothetical protein
MRIKYFPIILLFGIMVGCGQQEIPVITGEENDGKIFFKLTTSSSPKFRSVADSAVAIISVPGKPAIIQELAITQTSVEGEIAGIPAGSGRIISLEVYDDTGALRYCGNDTIEIIPNVMVEVTIILRPVTGGVIINGHIEENLPPAASGGLVAYYPVFRQCQ